MKKKIRAAKRSTSSKSSRRTTPKSTSQILLFPFSFRRIVLVTTALTLFLVGVVLFNRQQVSQSVAGISIARGLFAQATVAIPQKDEAVSYNLYYKERSSAEFNNAVRGILPYTNVYTISYLKKNEEYHYKVSAVDTSGREFWFSEVKDLTNIVPME